MSALDPPHDVHEKLYAAWQIINAVVAAAGPEFDHHYALEHVEEMLSDVAEALGKADAS